MHYLNLLMRMMWAGLALLKWGRNPTLGTKLCGQNSVSLQYNSWILRQHIKDSKFSDIEMRFLSSNLTYLWVWASCLIDLTVAKLAFCIILEELSEMYELKHLLCDSISLRWWMRDPRPPACIRWVTPRWMNQGRHILTRKVRGKKRLW